MNVDIASADPSYPEYWLALFVLAPAVGYGFAVRSLRRDALRRDWRSLLAGSVVAPAATVLWLLIAYPEGFTDAVGAFWLFVLGSLISFVPVTIAYEALRPFVARAPSASIVRIIFAAAGTAVLAVVASVCIFGLGLMVWEALFP